jgi:hypothetical protein
LFDDKGRVDADAVAKHLREILEDKPRLAEDPGGGGGNTANGGANGGEGSGPAAESENMNDLLRRK